MKGTNLGRLLVLLIQCPVPTHTWIFLLVFNMCKFWIFSEAENQERTRIYPIVSVLAVWGHRTCRGNSPSALNFTRTISHTLTKCQTQLEVLPVNWIFNDDHSSGLWVASFLVDARGNWITEEVNGREWIQTRAHQTSMNVIMITLGRCPSWLPWGHLWQETLPKGSWV